MFLLWAAHIPAHNYSNNVAFSFYIHQYNVIQVYTAPCATPHHSPLPPSSCPVCCMCRTHWRSRHVSSLTLTRCLRMERWLWAPAPSLRTGSGLRMSSVRVGRTGKQCRWSVCTHPHSHPCSCINHHVIFQTPPIRTHTSTDSQSHTYLQMQNRCVIV